METKIGTLKARFKMMLDDTFCVFDEDAKKIVKEIRLLR